MSSRSKQTLRGAKTPVRGKGGKAARRTPVKSSTDVPIMAVVVGVVLAVVFVGLLIIGFRSHTGTTSAPTVQGSTTTIPCDQLEHTQIHYHAAIQILDAQGTLHPIPGGVGIVPNETAPTCFYWLHVHSANQNVIHIESPSDKVFTLGDFFKVWDAFNTYENNGDGHEKLDREHVSTLTVGTGQQMVVYVDLGDGKGPQVFDGDPTTIQLKAHEVVTIEIVSGKPITPPSFDWNSASNKGL
jgi:hypothetical protein